MASSRIFYLTTPIYYVNARPHLGHAYTTIIADVMCRYRRLAGDGVHFLTGTDEHGEKIAQAAALAGVRPQEHADRHSAEFRSTWDRLGIRYDDFIRPPEPRPTAAVPALLPPLWGAGTASGASASTPRRRSSTATARTTRRRSRTSRRRTTSSSCRSTRSGSSRPSRAGPTRYDPR